MQGSFLTPDQNRAHIWFVKCFVKERFTKLAKEKHYDIVAFIKIISKTLNQATYLLILLTVQR